VCTALAAPATVGAQTGPFVTFLGVTNSQDSLINGGQVPSTGFHIVIEGKPGPSGQAVATSTVGVLGNPNAAPDLQILVDHDLGAGSPGQDAGMSQTCAGVPAETEFSDSQAVTDALNDFGCYFTAHGRDDACVQTFDGSLGFIDSQSTVQFCSVPIPPSLSFPAGDTVVSVRLRDVNGALGPIMHMTLQVAGPTMPPTTPSATSPPSQTPTSTMLPPTTTQTPTPTITGTATLGPLSTPTPVPCVGDCNGDRQVTIDEILTMVNIALENVETPCFAGDANRDGRITIDEILAAVNNALRDCD
jgi:hypothetical protein